MSPLPTPNAETAKLPRRRVVVPVCLKGRIHLSARQAEQLDVAPSPLATEPGDTASPAQVDFAFHTALSVAANIAQYVFKAEQAEEDWPSTYFVIGFDEPGTGKCWCKPVSGALIVKMVTEIIGAADDTTTSDAELMALAQACLRRIKARTCGT